MTYSYNSAYNRPKWDKVNCPLARRLQEIVTDSAALAKHLGCSVQAVNQYKQGIYPKTENLIKIAEYYQVSLDYLLGFTNIPNTDTTLQSINQKTGLSVDAIIKLSDIAQSNPGFSKIISLLLEDTNCEYFLALIECFFMDSTEIMELEIQGEKMNIQSKNLLSAILQTKLIENFSAISEKYNNGR